ncbi:A disintegrin and metalloproteinase with thrombospondin motifs 18-like isoform X2 [Oscarella lobularis]|uniref:A disintegrin and metalloproteinase with thrombospondin motifs 18-like isoform X2 n=1 Tax=Oscarella lobularis TaxID=121494 RepID=UPI0033134C53
MIPTTDLRHSPHYFATVQPFGMVRVASFFVLIVSFGTARANERIPSPDLKVTFHKSPTINVSSFSRTAYAQAVHLAWLEKDRTALLDAAFPERLSPNGDSLARNLYPPALAPHEDASAPLIYALRTHGEIYSMELFPSRDILSPSARIQTRTDNDDDDDSVAVNHTEMTECHMRGSVFVSNSSDIQGTAALSFCDGNMTGLILVGDTQLWVEPSAVTAAGLDGPGHPHVVYRRSIGDSGPHHDSHSRQRRASSCKNERRKFFVETWIVVDAVFHARLKRLGLKSRTAVSQYILTLINLANILYANEAVGYDITFVVVQLDFWEPPPKRFGFTFSSISTVLLEDFCRARLQRPYPNHDSAIYLTGHEICKDKDTCGELGRAYLGSICSPRHSCQVISDTGMRSGYVLAQLFGLLFSARHDGNGNRCSAEDQHLMAPTVSGGDKIYQWSQCSKRYVKEFFELQRNVYCLSNAPRASLKLPSAKPGQIYDLDKQCSFQRNETNGTFCPYSWARREPCRHLWCYESRTRLCTTIYIPPVDGTFCGQNKVCSRGKCVLATTVPQSSSNDWGKWSSYGYCSRSCGGGVRQRTRRCNGDCCEGDSVVYEVCNAKPCSYGADVRREACSKHRDERGNPWLVYYRKSNPCENWCYDQQTKKMMKLASTVLNGALCREGGSDRCVSGRCEPFGCDNKWRSELVFDACGVCGGLNRSCTVVSRRLRSRELRFSPGTSLIDIVVSNRADFEILVDLPEVPTTVFRSSEHSRDSYAFVTINAAGSEIRYKKENSEQTISIRDKLEDRLVIRGSGSFLVGRYTYCTATNRNDRLNDERLNQIYLWRRNQTKCSEAC